LIVLLCLVALVIFFLFPSVVRVRDSGGLVTMCQNNLRQLALACHNQDQENGSIRPYDSRVLPIDSV
jgi:hypothetical protein